MIKSLSLLSLAGIASALPVPADDGSWTLTKYDPPGTFGPIDPALVKEEHVPVVREPLRVTDTEFYNSCTKEHVKFPQHFASGESSQGFEAQDQDLKFLWGDGIYGHFYTKEFPDGGKNEEGYIGYKIDHCGLPYPYKEEIEEKEEKFDNVIELEHVSGNELEESDDEEED